MAGREYDASAQLYNDAVTGFPTNLAAVIFHFNPAEYFEAALMANPSNNN